VPRPQFHESGRPVKRADVTALEATLGTTLPQGYAQLMMRHNGGSPSPATFAWNRGRSDKRWSDVRALARIGTAKEPLSVLWAMKAQPERPPPMPSGAIPIGWTEDHDILYMFIDGKHKGEVWLRYDPDVQLGTERVSDSMHALYRVAKSFEAFIGSLQESPPDRTYPQEY
jgi:hypothetical protein